MRKRIILAAVAVASVASVSACGSDSTTPPTVTPIVYTATLSAANERPNPNASTATGSATYTLTGNTLSFIVTVNGLSGPATASHIHVGNSTVAGPVIVPFVTGAVASGNVTTGTIDLSTTISSSPLAATTSRYRSKRSLERVRNNARSTQLRALFFTGSPMSN